MHAVIFLGGAAFCLPDTVREELFPADMVIAADRGWDNAIANGVTPDLLVGDMDSIDKVPSGIETIRVPSVKNDADGQLAVELALARGASRITLFGQFSGRLDHTLSALFMLDALKKQGVDAEMIDDRNRVSLVQNESVTLTRRGYKYFGALSLGETVYSAHGCFYEVENVPLRRWESTYGISNEIVAGRAELTFSGDAAFLIESL